MIGMINGKIRSIKPCTKLLWEVGGRGMNDKRQKKGERNTSRVEERKGERQGIVDEGERK